MGQNQKHEETMSRWMMTGLQKWQKWGTKHSLDGLRNVIAKVEHQHYKSTSTLDKIQDMSYNNKKKKRKKIF